MARHRGRPLGRAERRLLCEGSGRGEDFFGSVSAGRSPMTSSRRGRDRARGPVRVAQEPQRQRVQIIEIRLVAHRIDADVVVSERLGRPFRVVERDPGLGLRGNREAHGEHGRTIARGEARRSLAPRSSGESWSSCVALPSSFTNPVEDLARVVEVGVELESSLERCLGGFELGMARKQNTQWIWTVS